MKRMKLWKKILLALAALLLIAAGAIAVYASNYSKALPYAAPVMADGAEIPVAACEGFTVYGDSTHGTGFIFYPGGKVEAAAYAPLLYGLAQRGICCVAVDMPLHLAVLKPNAADDVLRQITTIERWFIGGHSLGGAMAARYAAQHPDAIRGLVLLAAYPTAQLREDAPVLSLYGDADGVLNMEKYEAAKPLAPAMREVVLRGGNHAQFGNYGAQAGDGAATISAAEQWQAAVEEIAGFMVP